MSIAELDRYLDVIAPPIPLEQIQGDAIPRGTSLGGDTNHTRRSAQMVAVVLVLVVAGLGATWLIAGGTDKPNSTLASASFAAPPTNWNEVPDSSASFAPSTVTGPLTIANVAQLDGDYFAVGSIVANRSDVGVLWRSQDGVSWRRVDPEQFRLAPDATGRQGGQLSGITKKEGLFVVAGITSGEASIPVAYHSRDGENWSSVKLPTAEAMFSVVTDVVATSDTFVVIGAETDDAGTPLSGVVWRSADGQEWVRHEISALVSIGSIADAVLLNDRIVLAANQPSGGGASQASIWVSDDAGLTWRAADEIGSSSDLESATIEQLAVGNGRVIALGYVHSASFGWEQLNGETERTLNGHTDLALWSSDDGISWVEQPIPATPDRHEVLPRIAWGPSGFLVTTMYTTATDHGALAWVTTDGQVLTPAPTPATFGEIARITGTADGYTIVTRDVGTLFADPASLRPNTARLWTSE